MNSILDTFLAKLQEPSTWRGIIGLVTMAGVGISPEMSTQIIAAGLGLIGIINVIRKERRP